jgi:5-methylcytosine-specific restriction protein A
MKITEEQIRHAYELAKSVQLGGLTLSQASDELSKKYLMNHSSAQRYVDSIQHILSGQKYTSTINAFATDYCLSKILDEFGITSLGAALGAIRNHLQYYEKVGKSKQPKIHAIVEKFAKITEERFSLLEHLAEFEQQVQFSLQDSFEDRSKRLKVAIKLPLKMSVTTEVYRRNPDVVASVLLRANGYCEHCKKPGPFKRAKDGSIYLEVHHKIQLSNGGEDSVENAVALCPNCHRKHHFGL